jgi:hypothetical protein
MILIIIMIIEFLLVFIYIIMSIRFRGEWYPIADHRLDLSHLYECDEIEIEDDLVIIPLELERQ